MERVTDTEIIKALDILDKFEFFQGQRAGRELWCNKPKDVQDEDIESFSNDVKFLKDFINRQQVNNKELDEKLVIYKGTIDWQANEINRLKPENERLRDNLKAVLDEVKESEAEYEKVYEQAYNDARANLVDGGASCRLCMAATESKAVKEFCEKRGIEYVEDDI